MAPRNSPLVCPGFPRSSIRTLKSAPPRRLHFGRPPMSHAGTPANQRADPDLFPCSARPRPARRRPGKLVSGGEHDWAVDSSVHSGCRDSAAPLRGPATLKPIPRLSGWPCRLPDPLERLRSPFQAIPRAATLKSWSDPSLFAARFQAIFLALSTSAPGAHPRRAARTTRPIPAMSHNISQAGSTASPWAENRLATAPAWPAPTSARSTPPGPRRRHAWAAIRR